MGMPAWLGGLLLEEGFFSGCSLHEHRKKNEKNIFCLGCCRSICPHCASTPAHLSHPLLQVRRYVYHDVVRLDDLEKLIDCSFVQPYTINSAKVVFLKQRPQSRPFKGSGNVCLTCDRILQEPFHFCSLSCKVERVVVRGRDLSGVLCRLEEREEAFSHFESLRMDGSDLAEDESQHTPDSILEGPLRRRGAGAARLSCAGSAECGGLKKKGGAAFLPHIVLSLGSRRKGAPHRSPLS
ncbi:protein RGF1 INDUCIBLE TRANSCRIPTION FACTOR 1-like [Wolffia australiana]